MREVTTEDEHDFPEVRIQETARRDLETRGPAVLVKRTGGRGQIGLSASRPLVFALRPTQLRRSEPLPSVTAQAYSQCDRNELCIKIALSEHIMEASFNEQTDTAGLDVEARPTVDAEVRAGIALAWR
jgi:hypothetical protein